MKKYKNYIIGVVVVLILVSLLLLYFNNKKEDSFKKTYESLNTEVVDPTLKYRTLNLEYTSIIEETTMEEIVKKTKDKETFIVYFGFESCPWCRSIITTALEMAHEKGIKKIYYVDVRPGKDSYETDIRDEYAIDDKGKIYLDREGTEAYHELLKLYDNVLKDYKRGKITSLDKTEFKGAKRLGAPNIISVKEGIPQEMITGLSEKQEEPMQELTEELINDMKDIFSKFYDGFNSDKIVVPGVCDEDC